MKSRKADGSEVTVTELLELAKTAAFNALLRGLKEMNIPNSTLAGCK